MGQAKNSEELRAEIEQLNDQLKLLVRTEQRLMRSRAALERQLKREAALCRFSTEASLERDRKCVIERSLMLLDKLFDFERLGAVFVAESESTVEVISKNAEPDPSEALAEMMRRFSASQCVEQPHEVPWAQCLKALLGLEAFEPGDRLVIIPVRAPFREACCCLVGWSSKKAQASYYRDRPSGEYLAFFDLLGQHLGHHLERVSLTERSEQKHARLEASHLELNRSHAELEIAQERLGAVEKLETFGLLAGEIAHDFSNLLAVIVANAEIAQESYPCLELDEVVGTAERGVALIDQLLRFNRGREVPSVSLDVNAVVRGMQGILQTLSGPGVNMEFSLARELPLVVADHGQIEQILLNLVANARDASGRCGRIEIRTSSSPDEVRLEVCDQGHGLSREQAEQIFQPGFTTKAPGKGSGLGLSIVRKVAERHRGRIEVRSARGSGSRFRVCFPVTEANDIESEEPPPSGEVPVLITQAFGD